MLSRNIGKHLQIYTISQESDGFSYAPAEAWNIVYLLSFKIAYAFIVMKLTGFINLKVLHSVHF
jgi:hypothetical protein